MKKGFKLSKEFLERLRKDMLDDDYEEPAILACSPEIYQEMMSTHEKALEEICDTFQVPAELMSQNSEENDADDS